MLDGDLFYLLVHFPFLTQILQPLFGMGFRDTDLMTVDQTGSTKIGSDLDPKAAQFERHIAYRSAHAVQAEVSPDAEGAGE